MKPEEVAEYGALRKTIWATPFMRLRRCAESLIHVIKTFDGNAHELADALKAIERPENLHL